MLYKTNEIAKEFCSFYQQLYNVGKGNAESVSRETLIQDYLTQAKLPKLSASVIEALEGGGVSTMELRKALKSMASGKAPGPDGFTVAYYRTFADTLLPYLTYADSISVGGGLSPGDSSCPHHNTSQTRKGLKPLW